MKKNKTYKPWRYCLAAALSAGLFLALNYTSLHVCPEDEVERDILNAGMNEIDSGRAEAVNIGASTASALNFSRMGIAGIDLSFQRRDLLENVALIEIVLKRKHVPGAIFLNAAPISLLRDNAWRAPYQRRSFYRIIAQEHGWRPIGGDWSNMVQGRLLPLARADNWKAPLVKLRDILLGLPPKQLQEGRYAPLPAPPPSTADDPARLLSNNGWFEMEFGDLDDGLYFNPDTLNKNESALTHICDATAQSRVKLFIYSTPLSDLYRTKISNYTSKALPYWKRAADHCKSTGAVVIELDEDPVFENAYHLFSDPMHLNIDGSALLSGEIAKRLD